MTQTNDTPRRAPSGARLPEPPHSHAPHARTRLLGRGGLRIHQRHRAATCPVEQTTRTRRRPATMRLSPWNRSGSGGRALAARPSITADLRGASGAWRLRAWSRRGNLISGTPPATPEFFGARKSPGERVCSTSATERRARRGELSMELTVLLRELSAECSCRCWQRHSWLAR